MLPITVALAHGPGRSFTLEPAMLEPPRDHEVVVRITGVGICHTDIVTRDGFIPMPMPAVLGHEGAGIVQAVGAHVTRARPGDRVVLSFASCGACRQCGADLPGYCVEFPTLNYAGARPDGSTGIRVAGRPVASHFFGQSSFATHALTHERNVVRVADAAPLELLGPLGCGLQTGAGGVMRALGCPPGSSIAIFGGGSVGLAAVMGAVIQGCGPIVLVEPMAARRTLARELGATHVIDPAAADVGAGLRAIVPGGLEFAFETSGREAVVAAALASLASHGLLGLVGVPPRMDSTLAINLASIITFGHRVHGIIEGDSDLDSFIPQLIALHTAGKFPFDRLIRTFPFVQINEAVAAQERGDCVKAVLLT